MAEHGQDAQKRVRKPVSVFLHETDPYADFFHKSIEPSAYAFPTSRSEIFGKLIEETKPKTIVEIGSYLGASAFTMAQACKDQGLETEIVCIDTWLGTLDMWEKPDARKGLALRHGHPSIYRQFLANVKHFGFEDFITPFPLPSTLALELLRRADFTAQFVYVDGSHEYADAFSDIQAARKLGPKVILVDDFDLKSVREAVEAHAVRFEQVGNMAVIR